MPVAPRTQPIFFTPDETRRYSSLTTTRTNTAATNSDAPHAPNWDHCAPYTLLSLSLSSHQSAVHVCHGRANEPVGVLLPRLPLPCPQLVDVRLQLLRPRISTAFIHRVDAAMLSEVSTKTEEEKRNTRSMHTRHAVKKQPPHSSAVYESNITNQRKSASHVCACGGRRGRVKAGRSIDRSTTLAPHAKQTPTTASYHLLQTSMSSYRRAAHAARQWQNGQRTHPPQVSSCRAWLG